MAFRNVSVVITDLDNTLFDWVDIWHTSFSALVERLIADSGVPREQLLDEIREVHQRHGTSEYAFLIEELPSIKALHADGNLAEIYDEAIHQFRKARKAALKLYPGVEATLKKLKLQGVMVVGYTESMAFYSNYRMRHLGLDGLLDYLYSPPDHDLPLNLTPEQMRKYPADYYDLRFTVHRHTPKGELKPNPKLLSNIIEDVGARPEDCLYVGDSLMKDIVMAQKAGVADVHAAYGSAQHRSAYELLRRVTHWTPDQVEREREMMSAGSVTPTHSLEASFSEILAIFSFSPSSGSTVDSARVRYLVEIWKKTVDVQQHFNDIEMKIRNAAITVVAALLGATGFALKEHNSISVGEWIFPVGTILLLAALLSWFAFYVMDRHWYHRLLYGAVKHGKWLEKSLEQAIPEISLTDTIGRESPSPIFRWKVHSTGKMRFFYGVVAIAIVAFAAFLFVVENWGPGIAANPRAAEGAPNGEEIEPLSQ